MPVNKVKSHQPLIPDHHDFWLRLGNAVADLAAQRAHNHLVKPLTDQLNKLRLEQQFFDEQLFLQLQMRADLASMRSRLLNDDIQYIDPEEKKKDLINWTVDKPHFFSIPEDLYYIAHASRWGTGYTSVAMDWLRTLSWPMQKDENKPPVGITWVELAFNFLFTTQRSIPINIRENGATRYKNNEDDFGFDVRAHSFTRMVNSFRDSLEHIRYLTQCDIMPTMDPCKVKSICILGSAHLKQGVAYRPTMLKQKETMDAILSYLRPTETGKPPSFWNHPEIPKFEPLITQRIQEPANNTLAERSTRYNRRRKEIKLSRSH